MSDDLGGNWTPAPSPIIVTAGDQLVPLEAFDVFEEVDGVETALTCTAVKSTVRRDRSTTSTVVVELIVNVAGNTVTFGKTTFPNTPGTWWFDVEVATADGRKITVLGDVCQILPQSTVTS